MTTIATIPVHSRQRLAQAAGALLIGSVLVFVAVSVCAADGVSTEAGPEGPAQTVYAPAKGKGPAIIVLSGQSGPARYQSYTAELAALGYYAVLLDGRDILTRTQDGAANLRKAIERGQRSTNVIPGKTAIIGFSQGGGGALAHAASLSDLVSVVVAYYPATTWAKNPGGLVKRFRVPVLMMTGERDRYNNCCLIETARTIETAAKDSGARFELVVYPEADHGFVLQDSRAYRRDDERDTWRRTSEMLRLHHPLP